MSLPTVVHACPRTVRAEWQVKGESKITANAAIFISQERNELRFGFGHGADALGTQHLFDLAIAFVNSHLLQVGLEFTIGGTHGERPAMSKSCRLSAVGTLSHLTNFLSCYNSRVLACSRKHSILPHIVSFYKKSC
jgi:hypothetical protein